MKRKKQPVDDSPEGPLVGPEVTEDERSEAEGAVGLTNGPSGSRSEIRHPDPEVRDTARRRRFTTEYKLRIIREADKCTRPGEIGALLRREGLYSSLLAGWRRQRDQGSFNALAPKKRGRKPNPSQSLARENALLKRKLKRLEDELETAQVIIDVQKKVSEALGIRLRTPEDEEGDS